MVFKTIAGETGNISDVWTDSVSYNESSLAALNTDNSFKHHYKNRIVLNKNWKTFDAEEVCYLLFVTVAKQKILTQSIPQSPVYPRDFKGSLTLTSVKVNITRQNRSVEL